MKPGIPRIDFAARLFLYVLIFWLPYSPAVIESCVITAFILWIVKKVLQRRFASSQQSASFFPQTPINFPICCFLFICLLSTLGSPLMGISFKGFFTKTLEWFAILYLILEFFTEDRHIKTAMWILVATVFATAIDSLIQYYWTYKDVFLSHAIGPGDRATAAFKTPNGLGAYMAITTPVVLGFCLALKKFFKYYLPFILLILAWSLAVSGSRGAELGFCVGIGFLSIQYFLKKNFTFAYIG